MASSNCSVASHVLSASTRNHNFETYSLVWLDSLIYSDENRDAQQQFRSVINHITVFEDIIQCETHIRQTKDDEIVLIVSGQLGLVIVPRIHSLRQIKSIYVYCLNASKHQVWASNFFKIRAVITDLNELIENIRVDQRKRERSFDEPLPTSIFNSVSNEERSSTNIDGGFLQFQLLLYSLLRLPYSPTSRNEFFKLCEKEYEGNVLQLSILNEFKNDYRPEKALYWYTRNSFLYRMLNKALRIQNIDVLFLLRFFIQDLYQQLKKLQQEQDLVLTCVCRGQLMSDQELDALKKSKRQFISTNSFLSTSLNRQKSLSFTSSVHDDLHRVLFEIHIDPHLSDGAKPFANISSYSQFENEEEILFMVGSIFRVIDIHQKDEITLICMELYNEKYDHDVKLFEYMHKESEEYDKCLAIGHILRTAGLYDKAEQFYSRMLNELPDDHPLIADLWGSIGLVKKAKGELEISIQWFDQAFRKFKQMEDRRGFARTLLNMASIHHMKREFDQAIDKYNQALVIFKELFGDQNKSAAHCLHNLGVTYFEQRMLAKASQCYADALAIRKGLLPRAHPDIGMTLNNIGNVCYINGEWDQALHYFEQALEIYEKALPSEHPSIAQTYFNMGQVYCRKNDHKRALRFLNRAASIHHKTLSPDHPDARHCAKAIEWLKKEFHL